MRVAIARLEIVVIDWVRFDSSDFPQDSTHARCGPPDLAWEQGGAVVFFGYFYSDFCRALDLVVKSQGNLAGIRGCHSAASERLLVVRFKDLI